VVLIAVTTDTSTPHSQPNIKAAVRMPWCGTSMQPGSKGSFQAVKLQRPARATVCSRSRSGHGRHAFRQIEGAIDAQ
jgi:hypothetical protein